jgi:anti-sigma factor RsiW
MVEVWLLEEDDLRAFAAGVLDVEVREAVEAYLLHHPDAARRVEAYRRAAERPRRVRRVRPCYLA